MMTRSKESKHIMEYIKVTNENIEKEHKSSLACSLSKNREINLDIFGNGKAGDGNPDRRGKCL